MAGANPGPAAGGGDHLGVHQDPARGEAQQPGQDVEQGADALLPVLAGVLAHEIPQHDFRFHAPWRTVRPSRKMKRSPPYGTGRRSLKRWGYSFSTRWMTRTSLACSKGMGWRSFFCSTRMRTFSSQLWMVYLVMRGS